MANYSPSILSAFDKKSGEVLESEEVFAVTKEAFEIRRQYHNKQLDLYCLECEEPLGVSTSKFDNLHFKHMPNAGYCVLKDGNLSEEEIIIRNRILVSKESDRHKQLKNRIGNLLLKTTGVDNNSVAIDNRFIIRDGERRKPDVYCRYHDREIVFEIQLSQLSLSYILSRYDFYKKHQMFLVWVLEDFDVRNGQGQLERDIKYLTKHQNFFHLDEANDVFRLICDYKATVLTDENELIDKWKSKSVCISQLKFDGQAFQIYYHNYADKRALLGEKLKEVAKRIEEEKHKEIERRAEEKLKLIISDIAYVKKQGTHNYDPIKHRISLLSHKEVELLNSLLGFGNPERYLSSVVLTWLKRAVNSDQSFLRFILECPQIRIDVNNHSQNTQSIAAELLRKDWADWKELFILLFQRGYILSDADTSSQEYARLSNWDQLVFQIMNGLENRDLVQVVNKHSSLIMILESIKEKKIIGFGYKPNEWLAFANNAVLYYKQYWFYIESAMRTYGIWDAVINADRKGKFRQFANEAYHSLPSLAGGFRFEEIDEVMIDRYWDIHPVFSVPREQRQRQLANG